MSEAAAGWPQPCRPKALGRTAARLGGRTEGLRCFLRADSNNPLACPRRRHWRRGRAGGMGAASATGAQRTCKPLQASASSRTKDVVKGRRFFIIDGSLGYRLNYAYRRPTTQKSSNGVRYLATILRMPRSYTTSYSPSGTSMARTANSPIVTIGSDLKSSSSNDSSGVLPVVSKTMVRFW